MIRLLRGWIPFRTFGLFTSESALVFSCFLVAAYWLEEDDVHTYLRDGGGFAQISIVAGGFLLMAYFLDAYSSVKVKSTILLIAQVLLLIGAVRFIEAAVGYAHPYWVGSAQLCFLRGCGGSNRGLVRVETHLQQNARQ